jgi:hypothetical protein
MLPGWTVKWMPSSDDGTETLADSAISPSEISTLSGPAGFGSPQPYATPPDRGRQVRASSRARRRTADFDADR